MNRNSLGCALLLFAVSIFGNAAFAQTTGAVYVNANQATNEVWSYLRASDGTLTFAGKFSTQGSGSGAAHLDSQGSIVLSQNRKFLFVVNAVSNDITSFTVQSGAQLGFIGKFPSGGIFPNSLAIRGNLLYVINNHSDAIGAFRVNSSGMLKAIPNSTRALSTTGVDGAQVSFSNDGTLLVVAERFSSKLDTFIVGGDGRATGPMVQPSNGPNPFGFAFDKAGHLVVSEVLASAASSYSLSSGGVLSVITGSLPDFGVSACWTVNTNNASFPNQYSYITNTHSDTVSGYKISADGSISLVDADGITATLPKGAFPLDEALSADSHYLYVLEGHLPGVVGYQIQADGSLLQVTQITGTPATSFGMTGN